MRSYLTWNEKGNISMDFLTAVAVIVIAFIFAVNVISGIITPYSGYSNELYPAADRSLTLLIENEGYWGRGDIEGQNWEDIWASQNYSDVKKIGLLSCRSGEEKILDRYKISTFMHTISDIEGAWEYPANSTTDSERENASRAIGLGRYNYYLQIRPLDENSYNKTAADQRATEMVGDSGDVVSVVRYSNFNNILFKDFDGSNLFGSYSPKKILFIIENENFDAIKSFGMLKFSITNWNLIDNNGNIQNIEISDKINNNATQFGVRLTGEDLDLWKNNESFIVLNKTTSISMPIENSTDYVTIEIPDQTLYEKLPGWDQTQEFYIQMNVDKIEILDIGVTWFTSETYPVKIVLWVW